MATQAIAFRLPLEGAPRAVFETSYGYDGGRLLIDGSPVLEAGSKDQLISGSKGLWILGSSTHTLAVRLAGAESDPELLVETDGVLAAREDRLRAPTSRSAWIHGWIALAASFFGFVASGIYFLRSRALDDAWALKMAIHMAGWHLLLTLTLFPASVWGQRIGIRAVQIVSLVFFAIHACIAIANTGEAADGRWIAIFNAASGLAFAAAVLYGQRAHRDMDPFLDGLVSARSSPAGGSR
jgi:hypothetical protein